MINYIECDDGLLVVLHRCEANPGVISSGITGDIVLGTIPREGWKDIEDAKRIIDHIRAAIDTDDRSPTFGQKDQCKLCLRPIVWAGSYWKHDGDFSPRHPAAPTLAGKRLEGQR